MADYSEFNKLAESMPGQGPDVEQFYTPELQQMILDQLTKQAQQTGAQNQAAISGGAIQSGFGIGGTSREASRRARADADMLDQIVSGFVNQAQALENQRVAQQEDYASKKLGAEQDILNKRQQQELAKQGYQANFDSQQRQLSDEARGQRQEMLFGGLGGLAGAAGTYFGGLGGAKSSPSLFSANPDLNLTSQADRYGLGGLKKPNFWQNDWANQQPDNMLRLP